MKDTQQMSSGSLHETGQRHSKYGIRRCKKMRFQTLTSMSGTVPNVRRKRVQLYPIVAISLHNAWCSIWTVVYSDTLSHTGKGIAAFPSLSDACASLPVSINSANLSLLKNRPINKPSFTSHALTHGSTCSRARYWQAGP